MKELKKLKYYAYRLGVFAMPYFGLLAAFTLTLLLCGVSVGLFAVFGVVPLAIFLSIRISGAITDKYSI